MVYIDILPTRIHAYAEIELILRYTYVDSPFL